EIPEEVQAFNEIELGETKYELKQFHFHSPSEHHVEGKYFPLEGHFVHKSPDGSKIAVVGVLFDFATDRDSSSEFLDRLVPHMPMTPDACVVIPSLDLTTILESMVEPVWRYEGSLTTPPCTESVQWTVVQKPVPITFEQWSKFRKATPFNARPTQ
ncbi:hypothetical protein HK102_011347, partial [Quaeritorhiza haematococci]